MDDSIANEVEPFITDVPVIVVNELVLSDDQTAAQQMFVNFLINPSEWTLVLQGYAGTGKSTLVKYLLDSMPKYMKMAKLLNPNLYDFDIQLTATTNKAAEALSQITGEDVRTIHSFLGLRLDTNYKTGESELVAKKNVIKEYGKVLIIDEASMIDSKLLKLIFEGVENTKVMFIGDPAQILPVKFNRAPVFDAGFPTARLTKVMRQAEGNPIIQLATQFRETVETGVWTPFKPDGKHVIHLNQSDFEDAIIAEFTRPDWKYRDSKVLAWTNKTVIRYNNAINDCVHGRTNFSVGDYAVCNSFVTGKKVSIKTDQLVYITSIEDEEIYEDVAGNWITLDHANRVFFPKSIDAKLARLKIARANNEWKLMQEITNEWIDLRAAFAQTINKSQGSTYDRVYIDLDDMAKCTIGDTIARLLYVGVSRARFTVYLKGDFG